jgi:hypothetical protein
MRWLPLLAALGAPACTMPIGAESVVTRGSRARLEVFVPESTADSRTEHRAPTFLGRQFEMVLTNVSKRPLWVTSRIDYEGPSPRQGRVELSGPSGPLHPVCKACMGSSPSYRVLRPGEQLRMEASLACFGQLFETGVYTIRATYSPSLAAETYHFGLNYPGPLPTAAPPPPDGVDVLTEDVVSEPVHFRIVGPSQ